jgi:hypothetical protein
VGWEKQEARWHRDTKGTAWTKVLQQFVDVQHAGKKEILRACKEKSWKKRC